MLRMTAEAHQPFLGRGKTDQNVALMSQWVHHWVGAPVCLEARH